MTPDDLKNETVLSFEIMVFAAGRGFAAKVS
jgi:hypothetical protein